MWRKWKRTGLLIPVLWVQIPSSALYADMAQLVACMFREHAVIGSNPIVCTLQAAAMPSIFVVKESKQKGGAVYAKAQTDQVLATYGCRDND